MGRQRGSVGGVTGRAWAQAQVFVPSRVCATCVFGRRRPAFARFVEEAWVEKKAGRAPHVTRRSLHTYIVETFGYDLTCGALRNHLENCVGKGKA